MRRAVFARIKLLFFSVQMIALPANGIFINIFYVFFVIIVITDNVIVKTGLPDVFTIFPVTKTLECGHKL